MILDILRHTPAWVFVLLVALVAVGLRLARPSRVSLARVLVLPVAMAGLSAWSLVQSFGVASAATAAWLVLVAGAVVAAFAAGPRGDVQYSTDTRSFAVPGSWLPLALMMTIFFTRYAVAVSLALRPDWRGTVAFAAAVGVAYGVTSAAFAWRAVRIARCARGGEAGRATAAAPA